MVLQAQPIETDVFRDALYRKEARSFYKHVSETQNLKCCTGSAYPIMKQ
jgi:hypothetical protein